MTSNPWRSPDKDDARKTDPSRFLVETQFATMIKQIILNDIAKLIVDMDTEEPSEKTSKRNKDRLTGIQRQLEGYMSFVDNNLAATTAMVLAYYHSKSSEQRIGVVTRPIVAVSSSNVGAPYEGGPGVALMQSPFNFTAGGVGKTNSELDAAIANTNIDFVFRTSDKDDMEIEQEKPAVTKTSNRGRNPKVQPLQIQ